MSDRGREGERLRFLAAALLVLGGLFALAVDVPWWRLFPGIMLVMWAGRIYPGRPSTRVLPPAKEPNETPEPV